MNLSEISIRRPVLATMVLAALILLGIINYGKMNVDEMPDTSLPYVSVSITYEGAQPDQVESQVTRKVEEAIGEARGVKHIESISREETSEINVEFRFGTNPAEAAQEVRDKISAIRGDLPDGVKEPVISRFDMNAQPVISAVLTSDTDDLRSLSIFVEDSLKPALQKISGAGQVSVNGQQEREIQLLLSLDKLDAFGLSLPAVEERLKAVNQDIPAGTLKGKTEELSLRTAGNFKTPDEFNSIIAGLRDGTPVYFWQIGEVRDTVKDITSTARYDGKRAISFSVSKQSGANAVKTAEAVKEALAALQKDMPSSMHMEILWDDARRTAESIHEVWFDLIVGSLFALLIVFWFLGDWRSTVISGLAIPASIASTFLFMKLAGFSINSMSLLGLSLSVGLLIDDAIVVIENISRHRQMGKSAMEAALDGTKEIALAVMATTFTVAAVFLPVGTMDGADGQMFREFGLSIAFAVLVSLFVSFTLTPMMAALYLPPKPPRLPFFLRRFWQSSQKLLENLTDWYSRILKTILASHRLSLLSASLSLFLLSLCLLPFIGTTFMPATDQSQFNIKIQAPMGLSPEAMDEKSADLTRLIREVPEVKHVSASLSNHQYDFYVQLLPKKERSRGQKEIIAQLRRSLNAVPGVKADFTEGEDKPIAISITGPSPDVLSSLADRAEKELKQIPGVVDVTSTEMIGRPSVHLVPLEDRALDLGVSTATIGSTLKTMVSGSKVGHFSDTAEQVDVRLRLSEEDRQNSRMTRNVYVTGTSRSGQSLEVPLSQVVSPRFTTDASQTRRYDRRPEIRITANTDGISMGEAGNLFFQRMEKIKLPAGYSIDTAGASNDMDDSFSSMTIALILAAAFIFMILAAQFESYVEPFAIMFSLPLAGIGALAGLFLTGSELSLVSLIGIMMLMGLVTKNAILLIDFAKQRMEEGMPCPDALVEAGRIRLRPILMTSTAMIFGMIPIALGLGPGAEARAPMAHAIIGGVITSAILTLVVVPTVYDIIHRWKEMETR